MTARKAPATTPAKRSPVPNLRDTKREMAASRQRHPAGKQAPAKKPAPAKAAPQMPANKPAPAKPAAKQANPVEQEKRTYSATGRGGVTNTRQSATPLVAALDVKIGGRRGAQFAAGVVVGFYASREKAEAAAASMNGGSVADWSDAKVVAVKAVS